jgi:hypothetical protein
MRKRVNWFRIIADLSRCGKSTYDISAQLERAQSTVDRWANGSEPRHNDGEDLIDMWCREMGKCRSEVPMIRLYAAI